MQGEIASAIAEKIRAVVTPTERARLAEARPVNPEAYDACLKGFEHYYRVTSQEIDTALEYFELALKKDPQYALAYAGVATVWVGRNQMGYTAPREGGAKAKAAALKTIELDDTLARAHGALADVMWLYEWDWASAEAAFKRAIELDPNDATILVDYAHYLMLMKRPDEGLAEMRRAVALDPLNALIKTFYGFAFDMAGRDDEAIAQFREALKMSPRLPPASWGLSAALLRKGSPGGCRRARHRLPAAAARD